TSTDFSLQSRAVDAKTLVVFLDDSADQTCLREAFTGSQLFAKYPIKICVFCTSPQSIDNQLALLFNDFVFSPRTANELSVRLKLLKRQFLPSIDTNKKNQQPMLEEFTNLNLRGESYIFAETLRLIKQTARCDASV